MSRDTLADTLGKIASGWGASGIFSGGLYSVYARPDAFSVAATAASSIAASAKAFFGGLSIKALVTSAAAALGPVGLAILAGTVLVGVGVGLWIYKANKNKNDSKEKPKERNTNPPAIRDRSNTRKEAYEKAKRAGGGKEPRHNPNGHDGDPRPHYHPDVPNAQRVTPHQPTHHDHYYYP